MSEEITEEEKDNVGWDVDETQAIKMVALGKEVKKIMEEAITKVINAGIALFIVGDLSDADAIKEIEACLKGMKEKDD